MLQRKVSMLIEQIQSLTFCWTGEKRSNARGSGSQIVHEHETGWTRSCYGEEWPRLSEVSPMRHDYFVIVLMVLSCLLSPLPCLLSKYTGHFQKMWVSVTRISQALKSWTIPLLVATTLVCKLRVPHQLLHANSTVLQVLLIEDLNLFEYMPGSSFAPSFTFSNAMKSCSSHWRLFFVSKFLLLDTLLLIGTSLLCHFAILQATDPVCLLWCILWSRTYALYGFQILFLLVSFQWRPPSLPSWPWHASNDGRRSTGGSVWRASKFLKATHDATTSKNPYSTPWS